MRGIERNTANGSNEMTITTETILCVREVWDAISEATQDADAYGLTMLKGVAQKFDNLCDELINQAGDEGSEGFVMLCKAREFDRATYRQADTARRRELFA